MVDLITSKNNQYYKCEICEFLYRDKDTAQECEEWCRKNNSCNLEITKKAVKME